MKEVVMTANEIYGRIQNGNYKEALDASIQFWREMHWIIRTSLIGLPLMLIWLWLVSNSGFFVGYLLLPLPLTALAVLAEPEPLPRWVGKIVAWSEKKGQNAAAKGTFYSKWVSGTLYKAINGSDRIASFSNNPFLKAGMTLSLQLYIAGITLVIAAAVLYLIFILLAVAFTFWVISKIVSGESSSSGAGRSIAGSFFNRTKGGNSAYSENRKDIFGDDYVQHYDNRSRPAGYSQEQVNIFGQPYMKHMDQQGSKTGHSENRTDIWGDDYVQHFDKQGRPDGYSGEREDLLGNKYIQHFDKDDRKSGRSEMRQDLFGDEYVKHDNE